MLSEDTVGEVTAGETSPDDSLMDVDNSIDPSYVNLNSKDNGSSTKLLLSSNIKQGQNVCFICKTPHYKIARHFKIHIKEDTDIAKALSFPVRSLRRRMMLENLRNRGNFFHNQQVISKGSGTLKVRRRTQSKSTNYEYCIHCKAMYSRRDLWRHMKTHCKMKPKNEEAEGKQKVLGVASALKFASDHTVDHGLLKMLSRMHDDGIASVVRNDFYLMRYAESLYRKHGHDTTKHEYDDGMYFLTHNI